jgi:hypothetical protein
VGVAAGTGAGIVTGFRMTGMIAGAATLSVRGGSFSVIVWQLERMSAEARKAADVWGFMSGDCH